MLPQIASSVIRLADDPDSSSRDMEKMIERDSAIAAKVLRVANSSYYGLSQVASISRAISILGINSVRSLVVGIAYQQIIGSRQLSLRFSKLDFWRHSVAVATAAKILGKLKAPAISEELYTAALMHDVGLLVMDRFATSELDQAIECALEKGIRLHEAEQLLFEFDHAQVGALLADKWGLSPKMTSAIRYHHAPLEDTENLDFTPFIAAADTLAYQCGYISTYGPSEREIEPEVLELIGIPAEQLDPIRNVITIEVEKAQEALQIKMAA